MNLKIEISQTTIHTMKTIRLLLIFCAVNILGAVDLDQGYIMMSKQLDRFNALLNDENLAAELKREQLSQVVEDTIDFERIALKTLGPYASKLTPEQSERFHAAFKTMLKKWLVDDLMRFEDEKITLSEYTWLPSEKKVVVKVLGREKSGLAVNNRDPHRARTEYVLKEREGKWRIVDLTINRVNIAHNYRSQIDALVSRGQSADDIIRLFEKP